MKAFVGWVLAAALSVGLGLALYATSLRGATGGYQEAAATPRPTSTVIKTRTKVVRKPARTRVVYVPQTPAAVPPVTQPAAPVTRVDSTPRRSHDDSDDD